MAIKITFQFYRKEVDVHYPEILEVDSTLYRASEICQYGFRLTEGMKLIEAGSDRAKWFIPPSQILLVEILD